MQIKRSTLVQVALFAALAFAVYQGNVLLQSTLGKQALEATGLVSHPLDEALAQAEAGDKEVLVEVSAIWCPTCRRLDKAVLSDPRVHDAIAEDYVFTRLEYESDEGEAFMEEHGVRGFPMLLVLRPDGSFARQIPVRFDPEAFVAALQAPEA